jgi:hypothetical protein
MANIVIRCPASRQVIPTGLTTDMIVLDAMDITLALQCPVCGNTHTWKQKDAWIDERGKASRSISSRVVSI